MATATGRCRRIVSRAIASAICVGGAFSAHATDWVSGTHNIEGNDSYGSLNISGGTNTIFGRETFAPPDPSLTVGSLTFSGTASPNLTINSDNAGPGTLNLNGTLTFSGASGTASITSGLALTFPGVIDLGAATRTFAINNGSAANDMLISAKITNGGLTKTDAGTLVLTAANDYTGATTITTGTLQLGNGGAVGSLSTSSTITIDGTFAINRTNAVVQGTDFSGAALTGTGSFLQAGTGTTTLNQNNTFSGGTTINAGTLRVTNVTGSATGGGTVAINSGATLAGNGFIVNGTNAITLNSGGTIAPGNNAVGTLTTGDQTWKGGGTYVWELNATTNGGDPNTNAGTNWDLIDLGASGVLRVDATTSNKITVSVSQLSPTFTGWGQVALNEWFTIAKADAVLDVQDALGNGANAQIPTGSAIAALFDLPTTPFGEIFEIRLDGGTGDYSVQVRVTPEPGSLAMVAMGSAGLLLRRRTKRLRSVR